MNSTQETNQVEKPLSSWKEIANYLQRNAATVRRWEKEEGLPVHRHSHNIRSSVYAYPSEIDAWRETRKQVAGPPPPLPLWRRLLKPSFAAAIVLCVITVGSFRFMEAQVGQTKTLVCSGDDCTGKISPDGKSLLVNLNGRLSLRDIASKKVRTLEAAAPNLPICCMQFSPDGSRVVYTLRPAGRFTQETAAAEEVIVVNVDGTKRHTVYNGASGYAWSPDGKRLLVGQAGQPPNVASLLWVDEATGKVQKLPTTHANLDVANVSPDGKYVAFNASKDGDAEENVYIMASDGSGETLVSPSAAYQEPLYWTRDGRLVFAQYDATPSLWVVPVSNGKPFGSAVSLLVDLPAKTKILGVDRSGALYYRLPSEPQMSLETARFDFATGRVLSPPASTGWAVQSPIPPQYDWSPDGQYLAYVTPNPSLGRQGPAIVIRSAETDLVRIIQSDGILSNAQPRWAPDSRTLLVPAIGGIRMVDTRTNTVSTFKVDGALASIALSMPAWSPNQRKIYFSANLEKQVVFFESDPDLKNLREVVRSPDMGGLNLTPDARTIITPFGPNGVPLMSVPVAGGAPKQLHNRPYSGNVFISPDGKYVGLAVAYPTSKYDSAWVIPTGGGDLRKLLTAEPPLVVSMVMWAPDSKSVFLRKSTADGKQPEIWRAPIDGGPAVKIDIGINLDHITRAFRVSPAGNQIAYIRDPERTPLEVWVLKNFLPSSK